VIDGIVPAEAAAVEAFDDPPGNRLFPGEETAIEKAVDKRRREFITARACARAALARIGVPPGAILRGTKGEPEWPAGAVGSITHCDGYRAAVVARARDMITLGVDAEPHEPLPDGVLGIVASGEEQARLRTLSAAAPDVCWDRLLFSAKESVYKAWYPLARKWLDFGEADLVIDPAAGTFTARLLVPGPVAEGRELTGFAGRWLVGHGLALTAIAVPTVHRGQP
jgi:enterobactin synthetase component D / holo-[acyl-carrier protein] synthase